MNNFTPEQLDELVASMFPDITKALAMPELQKMLTKEQKLNVLKALGLDIETTESSAIVSILFMKVTVAADESGEITISMSIDPSKLPIDK